MNGESPTEAGFSCSAVEEAGRSHRCSLATICSMRRAVGLLSAAILLAGCGDQSGSEEAMDGKFNNLDYTMASWETQAAPYNTYLAKATQQYIALVREYADQLGPNEAKRRLVEKGDELEPYCLPCKATLYDEAGRY
jgi:hypothetical protein